MNSEHPISTSPSRRSAMVQAAAELLIAEGPRAITHRRVAIASGIPVGSANYIFPRRQELYAAAVEAAEALRIRGAQACADALDVREREPLEIAHLLIDVWYAPRPEPDLVQIRLQPMLEASADPELRAIMNRSRPLLLSALDTVLFKSGFSDLGESDLIAQNLDASLLYAVGAGCEDPRERAAESVARLLLVVRRAALGSAAAGQFSGRIAG